MCDSLCVDLITKFVNDIFIMTRRTFHGPAGRLRVTPPPHNLRACIDRLTLFFYINIYNQRYISIIVVCSTIFRSKLRYSRSTFTDIIVLCTRLNALPTTSKTHSWKMLVTVLCNFIYYKRQKK